MDSVAVISIAASSTVAIASLATQAWQTRFSRESDRQKWLRDKQAEAYVELLKAFWWENYEDQKGLQEWHTTWAHVNAYASDDMRRLFAEYSDNDSVELREKIKAQISSELQYKPRRARS